MQCQTIYKNRQPYERLKRLEEAKAIFEKVSLTLFSDESGFWDYLNSLNKMSRSEKHWLLNGIVKFYREFYKLCPQPFFQPYKALLEEFINEVEVVALTRRNSLFCAETIDNHPWIALRQAVNEYQISVH